MTDWQLLRRYLDTRSEAAFCELVERHRKLVYWTCLRETQDSQLAEDAAQAAFLVLARRASTIRRDASLAGWLFTVARHVSLRAMEHERRQRKIQERMAADMEATRRSAAYASESAWLEIEPWLNEALSTLPDVDRSAILLRHCEQFSFAQVAGAIGSTEEGARKRITRGLERLRRFLAKKDVSVSASVLAAVLLEHTARPLPASCLTLTGKSILAMSSTTGFVSVGYGSLLLKGATIIMTETVKKAVIASIALLLLAGSGTAVYIHFRAASIPAPGSQFQDVASAADSPDSTKARATIDQDYITLASRMMQEGPVKVDFMAPGTPPMNMAWNGQPHTVGITMRRFTASGSTATAVVDTSLRTHANNGRIEVDVSEIHDWTNTDGHWVLTNIIVSGKPIVLLNGTHINVTT